MRVLIAWEHGRNLGHVSRLLALAEEIRAQRAEVIWALPATQGQALALVRAAGFEVSTCPALRVDAARTSALSFADILLSLGFGNNDALATQVKAWLDVMQAVQPDRVLLDYAPAAQLAAHLVGLPSAQITNGFDAPPADCPPFGIGIRGPHVERLNQQKVARVSTTIEEVALRLTGHRNASLGSMFAHPSRWFDCIVETDPYGQSGNRQALGGTYIGPQGRPPDAYHATWPSAAGDAGPRVFAYLRGRVTPPAVLAALTAHGCSVICAWPDAQDADLQRLNGPRMRVVRGAVRLHQVLRDADVVVNYGSTTLVCQTLLAGKPQLMLPNDAEKWLVAQRVQAIGAGQAGRAQDHRDLCESFAAVVDAAPNAAAVGRIYSGSPWTGLRAAEIQRFLSRDMALVRINERRDPPSHPTCARVEGETR